MVSGRTVAIRRIGTPNPIAIPCPSASVALFSLEGAYWLLVSLTRLIAYDFCMTCGGGPAEAFTMIKDYETR